MTRFYLSPGFWMTAFDLATSRLALSTPSALSSPSFSDLKCGLASSYKGEEEEVVVVVVVVLLVVVVIS